MGIMNRYADDFLDLLALRAYMNQMYDAPDAPETAPLRYWRYTVCLKYKTSPGQPYVNVSAFAEAYDELDLRAYLARRYGDNLQAILSMEIATA